VDNDPRRWLYALRQSSKLVQAAGDLVLHLAFRLATLISLYYITDFVVYATTTLMRAKP